MERMTHERVNGIKSGYWSAATKESVVQRLAAYEDIGLMPWEIEEQLKNFSSFLCEMTGNRMSKTNYTVRDMVSVAEDYWQSFCDDCREEAKQIRERVKAYEDAEAEGRLVVLPCKVGDKVWAVGERRIVECEIDEAYLDDVKGLEFLVSYRCGYPEEGDECCKGCPFYGWHQEYSGEWSCEGEWGNASVLFADIGKTVFLTREEAEAALEGEGE